MAEEKKKRIRNRRHRSVESYVQDTPEMIQRCLTCTNAFCTNCMRPSIVHGEGKQGYVDYGKIDYRKLTKSEWEYLLIYLTVSTDKEASVRLKCSRSRAIEIRRKIGLPSPENFSEGERRLMVQPWYDQERRKRA